MSTDRLESLPTYHDAEILGDQFGFERPAGGFFLWLDVGGGQDGKAQAAAPA